MDTRSEEWYKTVITRRLTLLMVHLHHPSFGHCSPVADGEQGHTSLACIMYIARAGCPTVFQFASGVNF